MDPGALVDLAGLASGVIRIASYETQQRARVERAFEDGVLVEVRAARISQVLLNLLLNAAQAIPEGAPDKNRIEVRTRQEGDRAILEVLTGFKRAGASGILTYFAVEAARLLRR